MDLWGFISALVTSLRILNTYSTFLHVLLFSKAMSLPTGFYFIFGDSDNSTVLLTVEKDSKTGKQVNVMRDIDSKNLRLQIYKFEKVSGSSNYNVYDRDKNYIAKASNNGCEMVPFTSGLQKSSSTQWKATLRPDKTYVIAHPTITSSLATTTTSPTPKKVYKNLRVNITDGLQGANYDHTSDTPNVTLYRLDNNVLIKRVNALERNAKYLQQQISNLKQNLKKAQRRSRICGRDVRGWYLTAQEIFHDGVLLYRGPWPQRDSVFWGRSFAQNYLTSQALATFNSRFLAR